MKTRQNSKPQHPTAPHQSSSKRSLREIPIVTLTLGLIIAGMLIGGSGCAKRSKEVTAIPGNDYYIYSPESDVAQIESRQYYFGTSMGYGLAPAQESVGKGTSIGQRRALGRFFAGTEVQLLERDGEGERVVMPSSTDELWVIARTNFADRPQATATDDHPGSGAMVVENGEGELVPLPLKHTDVRASVSSYIASVDVRQEFHNPFEGKIEARYVFPLPQDAAVNDFVMTIGERTIRGVIREREEAEEIYAAAKAQGHVASLLTQERPNIFTQSVANIESGRSIDVTISYFNTLEHRDGWYEFVFPMVVGPRFNPPGSVDPIKARPHGATVDPDASGTTTTFLRPDQRSGHDIAITLDIDAGVSIEEFESSSHVITSHVDSPEKLHVELGTLDRIPNEDFVLRYRVAGGQVKSNLLTHRDARGGFFTLAVYPPAELKSLSQHPLEMVFVLDCSGSMRGEPIAQAKAAIRRAIQQMRPVDAFQIIRFSNDASQLGDRPLGATPGNVKRGLAYLDSLKGGGGTMMIEGIKAALDFPHDPARLRFVVFMTDGYIGNENDIFAAVQEKLGESRIFSFGVGSSTNGHMLDGLARLGKGAVAYLGLQDDAAKIMDDFTKRIRHPALMDVSIDWGDWMVRDVYPSRLPDVFVGRPLIVTGRFDDESGSAIKISGKAGERSAAYEIPADPGNSDTPALASIWARKRIMELSDRSTFASDPTLPTLIRQTALDYNLMSAYTAFIAVDSLSQTGDEPPTTVLQSTPVPEGVKYETTVLE